MTAPAVMLMVIAILVIWGGLVSSIIALQMVQPPYAEAVLEQEQDEAKDRVIE